ncbi:MULTISPECIES: menaquinone reductase [Mycobacterium avium complex (MAC)]|uniref:Menaquinone reductase n=1 Tax=Mycobacterium avium subsp. hominissuis TaxID=439334 RepID=A0AAI8SRM9_MYCAV|nr:MULTISPECIES: menaquinone reductase [Mycobacterium avium complex (MAC)]APT12824.1 FAD-linked oxidoreductase [Mycobacterium avium subsp. hominissuis]MBZ4511107.1 NAD(P)/FAD-dependent oxidoreductase [Mycobacterium avium subsp. hominissuis]MBZ4574714.1 NAD(P)/FAD-dependent oxidoreductase [Mycobacterium avium subsp. hominissuis]MCA2239547.1 NAD(P)/FAD-dependent oxidoreductase [Mycobacterium avium]MCA2259768.1 NAD(P)/FAD-dependent oxidoreductase [Mycobacterium avium]
MTTAATRADLVVVGAGPAGSAAAAWAARAGHDVLVVDAARFPRDKACGDGLTPRAVAECERLGLGGWLDSRIRHRGLRMSGFGAQVQVDWPGPSFPSTGSAVARTELDDRIRRVAEDSGARMLLGTKAVGVQRDSSGAVTSLMLADGTGVQCRQLIVADGARSSLGRTLGRRWHQETVYGVAARGYLSTPHADDPWLTSHLELRGPDGARDKVLPGYGWIFPLGNGEVNIGVGALSTSRRPAELALRPLIDHYTDLRRDEWGFVGRPRAVASALLPMGGAVSGVAGPNWMLIGDAAACVNPLNGEGIDYGMETGRLAAGLLGCPDLSQEWPALLREHYARGFSVARRLALLLTYQRFLPATGPVAMRSTTLMRIAVRVMANLVTDDDADCVARAWRGAGRLSRLIDRRAPFS